MSKRILTLSLAAAMMAAGPGSAQTQKPAAKPKTAKLAAAKKPAATPAKKAPAKEVYKASTKSVNFMAGGDREFRTALRENNKPGILFLYNNRAEASKNFEQKVLTDSSIVALADSAFLCMKLPMADNTDLVFKYEIQDVPAVVLLDRNGMAIDHLEGEISLEAFRKFLKGAL